MTAGYIYDISCPVCQFYGSYVSSVALAEPHCIRCGSAAITFQLVDVFEFSEQDVKSNDFFHWDINWNNLNE